MNGPKGLIRFTDLADEGFRAEIRNYAANTNGALVIQEPNGGGAGSWPGWRFLIGFGIAVGCAVVVYHAAKEVKESAVIISNSWREAGFPALVKIEKLLNVEKLF